MPLWIPLTAVVIVLVLLAKEVKRIVSPPAHEFKFRVPSEAGVVTRVRLLSDEPISVRTIEMLDDRGRRIRMTRIGERGTLVVGTEVRVNGDGEGGAE